MDVRAIVGQNLDSDTFAGIPWVAADSPVTLPMIGGTVAVDSSAGPVDITPNPANFHQGEDLIIKDQGGAAATNRIRVILPGTDTFEDGSTFADINANYGALHIRNDGFGLWWKLQTTQHVEDMANPHGTDLGNLGSGTLAELNTAVTDATLGGINDAGTGVGEVWSANKLNAEFTAVSSGYSRRQAVIDIATSTAAPPTEVSGDRYILDFSGAPNAAWDGASQGDIVEFDGASWVATSPLEGYVAYLDAQGKDALYVDDGAPTWEIRAVATTDHTALTNIGVNSHAQIDTHIADTANPHGTDVGNLGSGTLAELNTVISDATLIDTGDSRLSDARTPTLHAFAGAEHSASTLATVNSKISDATLIDTGDSRLSDARTPTSHAASHQNGGADEIATATPGANAIPKAGAGGTLADGWIAASNVTQHEASINHDNLSGFVANEHLDWTADQGATNVNDANIASTAVSQYVFASAEQTGTGGAQNIAHGLGVIPSAVLISVTDDNGGVGFTVVEGAHDATNVVVTVTASAKYKVLAFA
jgi:hypothetical protein